MNCPLVCIDELRVGLEAGSSDRISRRLIHVLRFTVLYNVTEADPSSHCFNLSDVVTLDDREVYDNQLKNIRSAKKATQTTSIILQNVATLIERISAVRPTLQHYDDALPAAARGEMVKALRHLTLAEEKSQHLPANISFVKWLAEAITDTKQRLIVASLQGVTKTLETLRTQNSQVGYVTLRNICRTRGIFVAPYHVREGAKATVPIDVIAAGKTTIQQNMNIRPLLRYRHVVQTLINETRGLDSAGLPRPGVRNGSRTSSKVSIDPRPVVSRPIDPQTTPGRCSTRGRLVNSIDPRVNRNQL
ncbi:hypothetical protein RvY_00277 [Ramazzottius varieornatus]|uniref:Uncharacterized protein n=1 Tax=Ramazzottius varieornatus TaxID=947166 RepID=A0A1D1UC88_RAMVA|nr:hypothetical protein RvY_00277 [Ramazzottius varieornatus]